MINVLSYVGMDMHSEVCLWTILGLVRTIFDATLFKVNSNLKQVWQMTMPEELSMPVQRALRTMISGVMLVKCFTVYVYLASYIVLMYPVFLEERPTLVLPWLLLAATRKLLCELTCLALGLGACVLLGPAKPPCVKFVIVKLLSITPAFYEWMLMFSYYHVLKVSTAFKTFTTALPTKDNDYGLELAVRRRRTKSLLGEDELRTEIVASLYGDGNRSSVVSRPATTVAISSKIDYALDTSTDDLASPLTQAISKNISDTGSYEEWYGFDVIAPKIADRILDQFVLMMLRIGAFKQREGSETNIEMLKTISSQGVSKTINQPQIHASLPGDDADTPHFVGSSKGNTASYLREYPQIFMKKDIPVASDQTLAAIKTVHDRLSDSANTSKSRRYTVSVPTKTKHIDKSPSQISVVSQNKQVEEEIRTKSTRDEASQPKSSVPIVIKAESNNSLEIHYKTSDDTKISVETSKDNIKTGQPNLESNNKKGQSKKEIQSNVIDLTLSKSKFNEDITKQNSFDTENSKEKLKNSLELSNKNIKQFELSSETSKGKLDNSLTGKTLNQNGSSKQSKDDLNKSTFPSNVAKDEEYEEPKASNSQPHEKND